MKRFTVYYALRGEHVHCRVFVDGAKSGELVMQDKEFTEWRRVLVTGQSALMAQFARSGGTPPPVLDFKEDGTVQVDLRTIAQAAMEPEVRAVSMDPKEFQAVRAVVTYVLGLRGDLGGFFHLDVQHQALGMVGLANDFIQRVVAATTKTTDPPEV